MATTTNFGWDTPDDTDYVTDGAAAMRELGQDIDTTLVDLKGGTTGQMLTKNSNTDMDFVWASPNPGDITGVTAGTGLTGGGTSGDVTLSFDVANYGGGQKASGKNILINGLLDIWQRSTSVTGQANGYATIDRWYLVSSASCTFAQESTVVPTGCRYSQKVTVGASASSTQAYQAVETSNAIAYAGQNVTFSGRFQSSATPTVTLVVEYSTDVDKGLATGGWVAITATSGGSGTAGSSSFTTISGVYAIPSTAKSLRFSFNTTSMASGAILYYGGFQAELGVVVTSLVRNGATLQGEFDACTWYYDKRGGQAGTGTILNNALSNSAGTNAAFSFPIKMRVAPTAVEYASLRLSDTSSGFTVSSVTLTNCTSTTANVNVATTGMTGFRSCYLDSSATGNYIAFSAEL